MDTGHCVPGKYGRGAFLYFTIAVKGQPKSSQENHRSTKIMKTIITGASGGYGRRAAELLLKKIPPSDLILTSRRPDELAPFAEQGVTVRYSDFDKPETLPVAFKSGERMLMISTLQVGRRSAQHRAAIDAAKKVGVRHIIYTSFVGIDPKNPALVVKDHLQTEELLKNSGLDYTLLRDSQYAESLITLAAVRCAEEGKWMSVSAEGKIALIAHDDCVQCGVAVVSSKGHESRIYHITGPELLSFRDIAEMTAKISGRSIEYVVVSEEERYKYFDSIGIPRDYLEGMDIEKAGNWASNDMVSFEMAIRNGYFAVISDDVKKLLGREPRAVWDIFLEHKALFDFN
jgi:NAD(P)H dehydrogenase (quinone)